MYASCEGGPLLSVARSAEVVVEGPSAAESSPSPPQALTRVAASTVAAIIEQRLALRIIPGIAATLVTPCALDE